MNIILLSRGLVTVVDDEDYDFLMQWPWCACIAPNTAYAVRKNPETRANVQMHRAIMRLEDPTLVVDHVDGYGLNNRRSNLRIATHAQNMRNSRKTARGTSSKYKGVHLSSKGNGRWIAQITVGGKAKHLGVFKTEEDAAAAYTKASLAHFGQFAFAAREDPDFEAPTDYVNEPQLVQIEEIA